jgi:predicted ribosomally synthesized peptide with SipW-like signal peptide
MSKTKTKRYLVLLAAVGLVAAALGGTGTFASFNAEVSNAGNTFQTGSLVLSNTVDTNSACFSSGAGNVNNVNDCGAIFALPTDWQPGGTTVTKQLTLENTGNLTPTALTWFAPLLTTSGSTVGGTLVCNFEHYTPAGTTNPYVGTGNPCTGLTMQVQEYDATFTTPTSTCVFPAAASACSTNYAALSTLPSSPATIAGGLAPATPRYFLISVKYPATAGAADNAYQAEKAYFDLTWHVE